MQTKEEDIAMVIHEEKCSNNSANLSAPAVGMYSTHLKEKEMLARVA